MNTAVSQLAADEVFFSQLEDFCRLVQVEFLSRFNEIEAISNSANTALSFTETLMLCPTQEAAEVCIKRDLPGALSFVLAIQGMQRQLQLGSLKLPSEVPAYQTRFYVLATSVREYLQSFQLNPT